MLYYFLIEDKAPKLVLCEEFITGKMISSQEEETSEETLNVAIEGFEEVVLFEGEDYLFKIVAVYPDYIYNFDNSEEFVLEVYWENRSSENLALLIQEWAVNGMTVSVGTMLTAEAGKTSKEMPEKENLIVLYRDRIEESDVPQFYHKDDYKDITLSMCLESYIGEEKPIDRSPVEQDVVHIYPYGEENAIRYVREEQDTDIVLVENENVSVIVTGYETKNIPNDTIQLFIQNKMKQIGYIDIAYPCEEVIAINGIEIPSSMLINGLVTQNPSATSVMLAPEACDFHTFTIPIEVLEEYGITQINEISFSIEWTEVDLLLDNYKIILKKEILLKP